MRMDKISHFDVCSDSSQRLIRCGTGAATLQSSFAQHWQARTLSPCRCCPAAAQPYRNPLGKKAAAGGAAAQKPAGAAAGGGKADGESPYAEHTVKLLAGACESALPAPPLPCTGATWPRYVTCVFPHPHQA